MRIRLNKKFWCLLVFLICQGWVSSTSLQAQEKKNRVRLSAEFVHNLNSDALIEFKATTRIDKVTHPLGKIKLDIYDEGSEEESALGHAITDSKGNGKFILEGLNDLVADSVGIYTLGIRFKGNDSLRRASKSITFKRATLKTDLFVEDSINYIRATLLEADTIPVSGESVSFYVERLFRPLRIGEEFNITDESGTVIVPVEEGIPAFEGKLKMVVGVFESDDYGTVKTNMEAPIGIPIELDKSHIERTLWSPKGQAPLFILFFTLFLLLGSWGLIVYLILNLFRIAKN